MIFKYIKNWLTNCFLLITILLTFSSDLSALVDKVEPNDINLSLVANATPVFINSSDDTIMCSGDSVLLFVKSSLATDSVFIKNTVTGDTLAQGVDSVATYVSSSVFEDYQLIGSDNGDTNIKNIKVRTSSLLADISAMDSIISCYDELEFGVEALASGGVTFLDGSYNYSWSSTDPNVNIINESTNSIIVSQSVEDRPSTSQLILEIEDSLNCKSQDTATIVWDRFIELEIRNDLLFFCEGTSASTDVFVRGGEVLTDYQWRVITGPSDFVTNGVNIIVSSGINAVLEVSAKNELGCVFRDSLIAIEKTLDLDLSVSENLVCLDDIINLSVSFDSIPNNPYSYNWEINGVGYSTAKDTVYRVVEDSDIKLTVRDVAFKCDFEIEDVVDLSVPVAVAGSELIDTIRVCEEVFFTSVDALASNSGTPFFGVPYQYRWSTSESNLSIVGGTTNEITVENVGELDNYIGLVELEITDSLGCTGNDSVWLEWNNQFRLNVEDTLLFCVGISDSIDVTDNKLGVFSNHKWELISGNATYSVRNDTTLLISEATNAVFTVEAIDSFGCPSNVDTVFINDVDINAEIVGLDELNCKDDVLNLGVSYDSLNVYSFEWFIDDVSYSSVEDAVFTFVSDAEVKVQVIDLVLGCIDSDSTDLVLSQPIAQAGLVDTISICNDVFDVTIGSSLSSNGTPFTTGNPYTYEWSSTETNLSLTQNTSNTVSVKNLGELNNYIGSIQLEITDSIGCTSLDSVWVEWDKQKEVQVSVDTLIFCQGATDSVKALLAGIGSFVSYDWRIISGSATFTERDSTIIFTSADNAVLEVVATDAQGCIFKDSVFVFDFDLNVDASFSDTVVCNNDLLPLGVSYDSLPNHIYTTKWIINGVDYSNARDTVLAVSGSFNIEVVVSDLTLGCVDSDLATVSISTPIAQAGSTDTIVVCNDIFNLGVGAGLSNGGSPFSTGDNYLYSWTSDEMNFLLAGTTTDNVSIENVSRSNNFIGLVELEITDRVGCSAIDSVWIEWDSQKSVKITEDTVLFCTGKIDSAKATLVGSGTFVSYDWATVSGTASFTERDSTIIFSSADNAMVEVAATDAEGCVFRDSVFVFDFDINAAIAFNDTTLCQEDVLNLSVTYDSLPNHTYSAKWIVDGIDYSNSKDTVLIITSATEIKSIVTDLTLGCVDQDSVEVKISSPVAVIGAREDQDSIAICSGSNQIFVSGSQSFSGTAPYQYTWSTTDTRIVLSDIANDTVQVLSSQENIMTDLVLTTTDRIGCTSNDTIVLDWQKGILATIDFDELVCNSINDTIIASPNSSDLNLQWSSTSNINIIGATDNDTLIYSPNNVTSDIAITLSLANENNCTKDTTVVISAQELGVDIQTISTSVCSDVDVPFVAIASEGSTDLFYNWDGLTQILNDSIRPYKFKGDSTIEVSVFDPNTNCSASDMITISIDELMASANIDEDSICFEDELSLELSSVSGGAGGYVFSWSGGELSPAVEGTSVSVKPTLLGLDNETIYVLTTQDTLGCTVIDSVRVSRNNEIVSLLPSSSSSICQDSTIELGVLNGNVTGGTGDIRLTWSSFDGDLSSTTGDVVTFDPINSVSTKTVNVVFTDVAFESCSISDNITIGIEAKPTLTLDPVVTICSKTPIVLDADSTDMVGVSYMWSPTGDITKEITVVDSLVYTVQATSSFGCENNASTEVRQSELVTVSLVGNDSSICTTEIKELSVVGSESGVVSWIINKADTTVINDTTLLISSTRPLDSVLVSANFINGCSDMTIHVLFDIKTTPIAQFSISETDIQQFQPFQLIDNSIVGSDVDYTWIVETEDENILSNDPFGPEITIAETGIYLAHLMLIDSTTGCTDGTLIEFEIFDGINRIYVPTALFADAENEENRVIKVYGNNISSDNFVFEIFNRWGESVYMTNSLSEAQNTGWDGTVSSNAINSNNITAFTFVLQGEFIDGSIIDEKGNITILK